MEEEPVMAAPDIEKEIREQKEFIVSTDNTQKKETPKKENNENNFDVDFSDVQPEKKEMTREDIIAAAEEAAFNNKDSE